MDTTSKSTVTLAATVTALAVALGIYVMWKKNKKARYSHPPLKDIQIPTDWQRVGEVGKLIIYPLKSAVELVTDKATCAEKGLQEVDNPNRLSLQDREFVLCTPSKNDQWLTMRTNSKIVRVVTEAVDKQTVKFSHPDAATSLTVKVPDENKEVDWLIVTMWCNEKGKAADCGDEAAKWFSQTLLGQESGIRLGYFNKTVPPRQVEGSRDKHAAVYKNLRDEYLGAFSDIASYMMLSKASVDDLNKRLNTPVTERNFRPNIIVKGCKPYAEDSWEWVKIGEAVFRSFKPTTRCTVVTVDPTTGMKSADMEPLRTLRNYRLCKDPQEKKLEGNSPVMGQYFGLHQAGEIKLGDPVYVVEK